MAADTDLLYKAIPGHPAKIRAGSPSQHQYPVAAAQRERKKKRNILGVCLDEVFLFFSFLVYLKGLLVFWVTMEKS